MTYPANPNVDALTRMNYFHRYCRWRRGQRLWVIGHATNNWRGRIWWRPKGLPGRTYAVADKVDPLAWYAIDYAGARIFVSRDGAKTFTQAPAQGLPADIASSRPAAREFQPMATATPGTAGELWLILGRRFFHTSDGARTFVASTPIDPVLRDMYFVSFGLGKAAPGVHVPTLYTFGVTKTFGGLWRSTDAGAR